MGEFRAIASSLSNHRWRPLIPFGGWSSLVHAPVAVSVAVKPEGLL
ncbi:hypothetical protein ACFYY8_38135 [Streptosporangium sp. NPDC001559]